MLKEIIVVIKGICKLKTLKKAINRKLSPAQILVLGFAALIGIGTILLNLPYASSSGQSIGIVNALFESTSAVCVTGLIVVDTGTDLSIFGQIVIMTLIQFGGLGFMTMATMAFLLLGKRITLRERLVMQEALNQNTLAGVVRLTKNILLLTLIIEASGALLLCIKFIPIYGWIKGIYFSIFHSISAFCNAGFDLIGEYRSLTPYVSDVVINITIIGLIILGGLGFTVILDVYRNRSFKKYSLHTKIAVLTTAVLILFGFCFFLLVEFNNPETLDSLDPGSKTLAALFQSVTPRTAGFNTINTAALTDASKLMTVILMLIGASPASTGGGIKTVTISVILLMAASVVRGQDDIEIFRKRIPKSIANRAFTIAVISLIIFIAFVLALSILEPVAFIDILFEVGSALGTAGLATFENSQLKNISKIIIILTMFIGRLGPLTLTLAFAKRQSQKRNRFKYSEEHVMVG